jgi:uncharacterized protein involved in exopolysaccharide biosynthesis
MTEVSITQKTTQKSTKKLSNWLPYISLGILGNAIVWGLVFAYLKILPPTYTSKWGVMILGTDPKITISLSQVGQASEPSQNTRPQEYQDPRSDYVYIATSPSVLEKAAAKVDLSLEDFGEPNVTTDTKSALIAFEITGETPEQAQQKSLALYEVMTAEIERLRQAELQRREDAIQATLKGSQQRLDEARAKLANYRGKSQLNADEQIKDISNNIEQLRRSKIELIAQSQGLSKRLEQLATDVNISDQEAREVYLIQADEVYQKYFEEYGKLSQNLIDLSAKLGPKHPNVVEKQKEVDSALEALIARGSFLLNKPVSQEYLIRLSSLGLDPQLKTIREGIFKDIVTNRADQQYYTAQLQVIDQEIVKLEQKLSQLSQDQLVIDRLEVDVSLAEAIFTATIGKLDLGQGDIYSIYPPIQLVVEPNLPNEDDPTTPDTKLGLLGGAAGTFLVISGLALLWWERKISQEAKGWLSKED